jgi:hypothetical protein
MATTTTNFGWDIPQSTDLVKDGATAIAALGQDIDTAMVDLKGGTTGQLLTKASGTDLDFSWASPAAAGGMTLISTTALTSGSTVTIGSIPGTYKNLFLVIRNHILATNAGLRFRFNSDSGTRYALQQAFNAGNTSFGANAVDMLQNGANTTTNNGQITCFIPDYANTVTWKQVDMNAFVTNASSSSNFNWDKNFGFYNQTSAITAIDLVTTSTFVSGSALLYGVS